MQREWANVFKNIFKSRIRNTEVIRDRLEINCEYSIHKLSQQVCCASGSLYNDHRDVVLNSQFHVLEGG